MNEDMKQRLMARIQSIAMLAVNAHSELQRGDFVKFIESWELMTEDGEQIHRDIDAWHGEGTER